MPRRFDLDWVRFLAFALLVPYHVGMYYVSWDWHVKSPTPVAAIEPLMILSAPWRLSLLFLVSGVATGYLSDKLPVGFLRQRSWRLLLPLLFGMYVVVPPQAYLELVEKVPGGYHAGYLDFLSGYMHGGDLYCMAPGDCVDGPTWNHLWFVAYLWVYTVLLWAGGGCCRSPCATGPATLSDARAAVSASSAGPCWCWYWHGSSSRRISPRPMTWAAITTTTCNTAWRSPSAICWRRRMHPGCSYVAAATGCWRWPWAAMR